MKDLKSESTVADQPLNPLPQQATTPVLTDESEGHLAMSVKPPDGSEHRITGPNGLESGQYCAASEQETSCEGVAAPEKPRLRVESWTPVCAPEATSALCYHGQAEMIYEVVLEGGGRGLLFVKVFLMLNDEKQPLLEVFTLPPSRSDPQPLLPLKLRKEIEAIILNQGLGYLLAAWAPFVELRNWLAGSDLVVLPQFLDEQRMAGKQSNALALCDKLSEAADVAFQCLDGLAPSGWLHVDERRAFVQDELNEICTLLCVLERGLKAMSKAAYIRGGWGEQALDRLASEATRYRRNMVRIRDQINSALHLLSQC